MASIFFISLTSFFSPASNVVQRTSQHELSRAALDVYTSQCGIKFHILRRWNNKRNWCSKNLSGNINHWRVKFAALARIQYDRIHRKAEITKFRIDFSLFKNLKLLPWSVVDRKAFKLSFGLFPIRIFEHSSAFLRFRPKVLFNSLRARRLSVWQQTFLQ